jgi:hypothetical protein
MKRLNAAMRSQVGAFVALFVLSTAADVTLASASYTPAPPSAVPVEAAHARHGMVIAADHPRTRLTDGSGRAVWEDPRCGYASQVDDWWLGSGYYAVLDPPNWFKLPMRADAWLGLGVVSGLHIRFAPPISKTSRIREIVQADLSLQTGSYCVFEEFYRSPGRPSGGGIAYWSRMHVTSLLPAPKWQRPVNIDNSGWPTPSPVPYVPAPSFFPSRPRNAEIHYRSGVLTQFGAGNKSGYAAIRDASGQKFGYFTGWPMYIDGKQTHCAVPPMRGQRIDPILCEGGWPANVVIGSTLVRVYYWHAVTPWGQHVSVTDEIDRAPLRD